MNRIFRAYNLRTLTVLIETPNFKPRIFSYTGLTPEEVDRKIVALALGALPKSKITFRDSLDNSSIMLMIGTTCFFALAVGLTIKLF